MANREQRAEAKRKRRRARVEKRAAEKARRAYVWAGVLALEEARRGRR